MKKISVLAALLFVTAGLCAEIGWSGNIWPNSGSSHLSNADITVYYQIWKDGVTNLPGQGDSISATLFYKDVNASTYDSIAMVFNIDVGNNDEYMGTIPYSELQGVDTLNFYCEGYDSTDASYSYGTDQNNAGPFDAGNPGSYLITPATLQNVTVTFQVYMGGLDSLGYNNGVSVQGSIAPLDWNPGSNLMTDSDGDLIYTGDITFPTGSLPEVEYKFTRCNNESSWSWEDAIGDRQFTIDDSDSTQILDWVYWDDIVPVPQDVAISVVGQDVNLSWDAIFGATDYEVLRSSDPYSGFTHLANTDGATNYIDPGAGVKYRAEKYFYQIKAIQ